MAISYRPYEPQQEMLLPASLQDWLPKGHLAYFISDTVDALDLKAFYVRYAGGGARNQPFHPAMMVKVLVYGYATGVFSSRKIERRLHEDLAFRMLGAGNFPKHRTIRDFRALHLKHPHSGQEFWVQPDLEFAMVRATMEDGGVMELTGQGTGAKSSITETPTEIPGLPVAPPPR